MGLSKILVGLLLVGVIAASPAADHPYQAIAARNVFGLKDPPPPPNPEDNKPPPPKILLQGIATVVGTKQVLFEVETPPKPPQTGGRTSMLLGVGEAQDEIEVLEILDLQFLAAVAEVDDVAGRTRRGHRRNFVERELALGEDVEHLSTDIPRRPDDRDPITH